MLQIRQIVRADAIGRGAFTRPRIDNLDLFQNRALHEPLGDTLLGGVAGTAAAALAFAGTLDDVDLAWLKGVVERASETPEINNGLWFSGSIHSHHPCDYAARGFAALIRRDVDAADAKRRLLHLAAHPLDQISEEAIGAALGLWQDDPNFAFIALDLGLSLSVGARQAARSAYGYEPSENSERRAAAVGEALHRLDARDPLLTLMKMPPAWVSGPQQELEVVGSRRQQRTPVWRKPDELWLWHYAPRVLRRIPVEHMLADDLRRPAFLSMCSDLLNCTVERLALRGTLMRGTGMNADQLIFWNGAEAFLCFWEQCRPALTRTKRVADFWSLYFA